jgi:uncharacterized LabA/DUF88 family protein
MLGDTYLFIDGGYLETVYRDLFNPLFGGGYLIDYQAVMQTFGAHRAYLYDCLDDLPKEGETETDFKARVERQEAYFDAVDKVEGVHVRHGYLSPGKKRQQKEVDVLLVVDMLTHAFNKNMDEAVLLSGDRDFRPVVESVVRMGIRVKVAYDPRTGSRPLARAADREMEIDLAALCRWIKVEKYDQHSKHFPQASVYPNYNYDPFKDVPGYCTGFIGPEKLGIGLCEQAGIWYATVKINARDYSLYTFHDRAKLIDFLTVQCGEIVWS